MSRFITLCLLVLIALSTFKSLAQTVYKDYLIYPVSQKASVNVEGRDLILNNGLVKRVFRLSPNVACTDYTNLINGQQLLRSVEPEARIIIDGKQYEVGGLRGQKEKIKCLLVRKILSIQHTQSQILPLSSIGNALPGL